MAIAMLMILFIHSEMMVKNVFLRLCGGFSVMIRPDKDMDLDLPSLEGAVPDKVSKGMMKFHWHGVEITMYPSGGLIFYHFEDQDLAERYAHEIWDAFGLTECS